MSRAYLLTDYVCERPSPSAYNHGCRCDECRHMHRERLRQARKTLASRVTTGEVPHGTAGGYKNWSCRCDACTTASASAQRSQSSSALPRGDCPVCGRSIALRTNGRLREHHPVRSKDLRGDGSMTCRGSAGEPAPAT